MTSLSNMRLSLAIAAVLFTAMAVLAVPAVRAQSPPAEALFIRASVDNAHPYLGQQITYSLRIYQRQDADLSSVQVRYSPPGFAGFWNSQQTRQDEYDETEGSIEYRVVEVRTVLFASVVEDGEIGPAVLEVSAAEPGASRRLQSDAVAVEVRALPVPEPEGFTGAVGRLEVSASVDTDAGKLNEPVLLTLRISGEGNIEALPDPQWPEFVGWRVIESPVSVESQVAAGQITGSRAYEIALMPQQAGSLTIPEIRYPYFDPALERYVEIATAPFAVSIGDAGGAPVVPVPPMTKDVREEAQALRPIRTVPPSLRQGGTELANSKVYWAAWGIPALAVVAAAAWRRRRASQDAARAEARRNSALPGARAALNRATALGDDPRVAASGALLSYLSARLELQVAGATRETLFSRLREVGISPELEDRISEVLTAGESARYTPHAASSGSAGDHAGRALRLMDELEEVLAE